MQNQTTKVTSTNRLETVTNNYNYDSSGNVLGYRNSVYDTTKTNNPFSYSNDYSYTYVSTYSGFQVSAIGITSSQKGTAKGITSNSYDSRGRLVSASITDSKVGDSSKTGNSYRQFAYNAAGQVIMKAEQQYGETDYKTQNYYYSPTGGELANLGAKGVNLTPLQPVYEGGSTPSSYTVNGGDTLMGIAQTLFGDANLWYLVADANALSMGPTDAFSGNDIGRNLRIPNTDKAIGNTSANWKPYNPTEMVGDLTPTVKIVPPKKKGCNIIAMIVMIVIAVVLTVVTAGAAAMAMAGTLGSTFAAGGMGAVLSASWAAGTAALVGATSAGIMVGGTVVGATTAVGGLGLAAASAIGGFVGSIGSQASGMAMGVVDRIDLKQAFASGITAGFASGAGSAINGMKEGMFIDKAATAGKAAQLSNWGYAARGAVSYLSSTAANKIAGLNTNFSWASLAASSLSSVINQNTGNALVNSINDAGNPFLANVMSNLKGGIISSALNGLAGQKMTSDDWGKIAVDAFGNALAREIVDYWVFINPN